MSEKYIVKSVWGNDNESKGMAAWDVDSIEEAKAKHLVYFPNEQIIEVAVCDGDHFESIFDAVSSEW